MFVFMFCLDIISSSLTYETCKDLLNGIKRRINICDRGDTSPKKNRLTPFERIKKISMEFTKGNLQAKLKKTASNLTPTTPGIQIHLGPRF